MLSGCSLVPAVLAAVSVNPVLPLWEHVPDAEPRVFDGRLYVYGSHDKANGWDFCLDDYVAWSAPLGDLGAWRREGVIFAKTDDPENVAGHPLYAPDVVRGADGRYYLYYQRNNPARADGVTHLGVAVCDTPGGRFRFLGYVRRTDGTLLGDRAGDNGFDPSVLVDGRETWLFTGSAGSGAFAAPLGADMLTLAAEPVRVIPGRAGAAGTPFEGNGFVEASSVRRIDGRYVFVYSPDRQPRLCYATAERPDGPYAYRGTLVENAGGNNHGGLVQIGGEWFIFYHRTTNDSVFERQCCVERLTRGPDGEFREAEMTSLGFTRGALPGCGDYPAAIACAVRGEAVVRQLGEGPGSEVFVGNLKRGDELVYRRFDCRGVRRLGVEMRGWAAGEVEVRLDGTDAPVGRILTVRSTSWAWNEGAVEIPDGVHELRLRFLCDGRCGRPQVRTVRLSR